MWVSRGITPDLRRRQTGAWSGTTSRCTGTARAREAEDGSRAEIGPRGGPKKGYLHIFEDRAGALGSRCEDGRER